MIMMMMMVMMMIIIIMMTLKKTQIFGKMTSLYWIKALVKAFAQVGCIPQGEQSRYSNHPRAHTVKLGRMTTWKNSPHPWSRCQTRSYHPYQVTQTPLFSNTLMLPFDNQVCHECQICLRFHWILKVILEMAFSAHCTYRRFESWIEFQWPLLTKLPENAFVVTAGFINAWRQPHGGKLSSGVWKCG